MTDIIGVIGSILLAICSLPLAYQAYVLGYVREMNMPLLILWTLGEVFSTVYIISIGDYILLLNYATNIVGLSIVWKYILYPRDYYTSEDR